jgi:hypothetical protein
LEFGEDETVLGEKILSVEALGFNENCKWVVENVSINLFESYETEITLDLVVRFFNGISG